MAHTTKNNTSNPWKGLNFYVEGEILFGRNDEIESLSQYIINNTQTVLYGKSGIGKSSIINAGIFPIARKHGLLPVPIRFDHAGIPYIEQIKTAIRESGAEVHEILPAINANAETLWEFFHRNIFFDKNGRRIQLLVVIDQFEEFFTLQQDENTKRAFFDELADLINDIKPLYIVNANKRQDAPLVDTIHEVSESLDSIDIDFDLEETQDSAFTKSYLNKIDYHIVFTLREDFLSYLERYTAYIPIMKTNRYALLPINEEQAADIIMKPQPGLVSEDVAELIIQKVTGNTDFKLNGIPELEVDAAVLSLYLSRLYIMKGEASTITAELVNQFSRDIIRDFYEESVQDIPTNEVEKIEDQLLTYDGRRNNVSRYDLIRDGVSPKVIKTLVEDRKLLRQFSYQDDIRVEFMHDILCPIVDSRIENREEARRLLEEQRRKDEEQRKFMEEEQRKRDEIEANARATLEAIKAEANAQKLKNKRRFVAFFAILAFGALVWFGWYFADRMTFRSNYASFTTKNGWPKGLGKKVSRFDRNEIPIYYQLVKTGFWSDYTQVNVMNWDNQNSINLFVESPLVSFKEMDSNDDFAKRFALLQRQTSCWKYFPDNDGRVFRKTAYDSNGKELYSIQYFKSQQGFWANIIDNNGQSFRVRDNGADRIRITTDENGFFNSFMFFNESGVPMPNHEDVYGYKYVLNLDGMILAKQPLDIFGDTIKGEKILYGGYNDYGIWHTEATNDTVIEVDRFQLYQRTNDQHTYTKIYEQPDSVFHYRMEYGQAESMRYTVSYFEGSHRDSIDKAALHWTEGNGSYHKATVDTVNEGGQTKVIKQYFDPSLRLAQSTVKYNKSITYYSDNGEMLKLIRYKNDTIQVSYIYEYQNGIMVSQSVMGAEGTPIRCPNWEENGLCYYRMRLVRDAFGDAVAIRGFNEFGEESLITFRDYIYDHTPMAPESMKEKGLKEGYIIYGRRTFIESATKIINKQIVDYIHILDTTGSWYQSGLRDGDLIVKKENNTITIARPDIPNDTYNIRSYTIDSEDGKANSYPVYFTEKEMNRYIQAINNK